MTFPHYQKNNQNIQTPLWLIHEDILGLQSEQSLGSPSTFFLNHTAPNWRAPCPTQPPLLPWQNLYIGPLPLPASQSLCTWWPPCTLQNIQWLYHKRLSYSYIRETVCKNLMTVIFCMSCWYSHERKTLLTLSICPTQMSIQLSVHCKIHTVANIDTHTNTT